MEKVFMTEDGLRKLETELEFLKGEKRREVSEKIKVALGYGDLSENSEYDEAKNEQAMVEARIMELEAMLQNVQLIDETTMAADIVHLGTKLTVHDEEAGEDITYQIVGSKEANPLEDRISDESPVGKALLGHRQGDVVDVETPGGAVKYHILSIEQ